MCGLALASHAAARDAKTHAPAGKVLIVADEWGPMEPLTGYLRQTAGYAVESVDQKKLPKDLGAFAGVFMYVHGRLSEPASQAMIAYTQGGGRLVILHHGIASGKVRTPSWMAFTGMHIAPRDDPNHPWKVLGNTTHTLVNLRPGHYVTSHRVRYDRRVTYLSSDAPSRPVKLPAIDLPRTEIFLNQHFTDGRAKTVLFGFLADPGEGKRAIMQDRSGWYKPAGKGWVFYLQPGHAAADFQNGPFRQILWNCLTWRPEMRPCGWSVRVEAK